MSITTSEAISDFQPFGMEFRNDPYPFYPKLLANSPLRVEVGGETAVVVSRHRQVRHILSHHKDYSSVKPAGTPGMERVDFFNSRPVMNYCDPPEHTNLRRIVNPAFTPRNLNKLKIRSQAIVEDIFEELGDKPEFDAVLDFGVPFSRRLLMNSFMGVPEEEEYIFMDWLTAIPLLDKVEPGGGKPQEFIDAWNAGTAYCDAALNRAPSGDSENIVQLIAKASKSGRITKDDVLATMLVLFAGGLTTVSATTGASMLKLAEYPEVAARIRKDPELAARHFEETLRTNPALTSVMRFPTHDVTFEGMEIARDTPLYVMLSAACHDADEFPDPYRFDIDRANFREHMGFGAGQHTCIGNVIARAVIPPLIAAVARRYPDLRRSQPNEPLKFDVANPRVRHLASVRLAA
jgi:cytochrome P450